MAIAQPAEFLQVQDGKEHFPQLKAYQARCCDCGLVHEIDFRLYQKLPEDQMVELPSEEYLISITARRLDAAL